MEIPDAVDEKLKKLTICGTWYSEWTYSVQRSTILIKQFPSHINRTKPGRFAGFASRCVEAGWMGVRADHSLVLSNFGKRSGTVAHNVRG